jgi:hypothetical protein
MDKITENHAAMHILRVPLSLPKGRYRLNLCGPVKARDGLVLQIKRAAPDLILEISGLPSLEASRALNAELEGAFIRMLLLTNIPVSSTHRFEVPTQAQGLTGTTNLYNASFATAFPAGSIVDGMSAIGTLTEEFQDFQVLEPLREWLEDRAGKTLPNDKKFRLASTLYLEHFSEESVNAKFLTLFLSLESLFVSEPKPDKVTAMMTCWEDEAKRKLDAESDPEVRVAYKALLSELSFRRGSSLKSQLRSLIRRALPDVDEAQLQKLSKQASELYDLRSKLVHDGEIPGGAGSVLHVVKDLVRLILGGLAKLPG